MSLAGVGCFQQSFNQLSISDSQVSDSMQASAGTTGASTASSTTGIVTSGGISQTGGAETIETAAVVTTHDTSTSGNSTLDPDETSAGTSTGQQEGCEAKPLLLDGTCYGWEDVRLVFVTSEIFNGSMTDPDALCAKAAMDAWPEGPNDFKAWATVNKIPPAIRFDKDFDGPYVKLNPEDDPDLPSDAVVLVAMGWKGLTTKELLSAIDVTEKGEPVVMEYAWTAVRADGLSNKYLPDCYHWSRNNSKEESDNECEGEGLGNKNDYGTVGAIGATASSWSYASELACASDACCLGMTNGLESKTSYISECDSLQHLYCILDNKK